MELFVRCVAPIGGSSQICSRDVSALESALEDVVDDRLLSA
ncbi:hypothetical protein HSR121_0077 [Halapricum desulfuricans]|uniref:Uncharacterized protein n=1 Tax=Halapricum desulfuricans TaxID=2841257 RepID=A0A897MWT2_9EURY|nr:hypothetical protein HSR121_0077 [Halapricum desulfuricans]